MAEEQPGDPHSIAPWRSLSWWSAFLIGAGIALQVGPVLVEQELLTPRHKAWVSVMGALVILGGLVAAWLVRRGAVRRD